jgi:hypothetical protein
VDAANAAREGLIRLAREDVNVFVELVMRNPDVRRRGEWVGSGESIRGLPIEQYDLHLEMQTAFDRSRHVTVFGAPELGKTVQAIGRVLFELGRNPESRGAFVGNTQNSAKKSLALVKQYVERSEELHAVFPHLVPGDVWRDDAITVRREAAHRDPTIQTVGLHGDIVGSRLDWWLADDLVDWETSRTPAARDILDDWFRKSVITRESEDAWSWLNSNVFHEDDLPHRLEREGRVTLTYPVMREDGSPTCAPIWSLARIESRREKTPPRTWTQLYMCRPRADGDRVFSSEGLERACELGRSYDFAPAFSDAMRARDDVLVVHGVDMGAGKTGVRRAAANVVCSLLFRPSGAVQLLRLVSRSSTEGGRETTTAWMVREMVRAYAHYGGVFVVEDNAQQRHVYELVSTMDVEGLPAGVVRSFTTSAHAKVDPSLGIELFAARVDQGAFVLSNPTSHEVRKLYEDMDTYDPLLHTGDRLMATWMAWRYGQRILDMRRAREDGREGVSASAIGGAPRAETMVDRALEFRRRGHELDRALELAQIETSRIESAREGMVTLDDLRGG